MNGIKVLRRLLRLNDNTKDLAFDDSKVDEYTREAYNMLKKVLGNKVPSYDMVRKSVKLAGKELNKIHNGNK